MNHAEIKRNQQILVMYWMHEKGFTEIADHFGTTIHKIKTIVDNYLKNPAIEFITLPSKMNDDVCA